MDIPKAAKALSQQPNKKDYTLEYIGIGTLIAILIVLFFVWLNDQKKKPVATTTTKPANNNSTTNVIVKAVQDAVEVKPGKTVVANSKTSINNPVQVLDKTTFLQAYTKINPGEFVGVVQDNPNPFETYYLIANSGGKLYYVQRSQVVGK